MSACTGVLQGVIADLKLRGDPRAAEHQCEEEEDDAEVSLGWPQAWGDPTPSVRLNLSVSPRAIAGIWRFRQRGRGQAPALGEGRGELALRSVAACWLARLKAGVPSSPAQGVPGLVDAVPVTSPPVAADGGSGRSSGSPQQAERTRAEERLRVPAGGNAGTQEGGCPQGCQHPEHPGPSPVSAGPKGEKGEKGERGLKGDSGTGGVLGTGSTKGEKVGDRAAAGGCLPRWLAAACPRVTPTRLRFCPAGAKR